MTGSTIDHDESCEQRQRRMHCARRRSNFNRFARESAALPPGSRTDQGQCPLKKEAGSVLLNCAASELFWLQPKQQRTHPYLTAFHDENYLTAAAGRLPVHECSTKRYSRPLFRFLSYGQIASCPYAAGNASSWAKSNRGITLYWRLSVEVR